MHRHPRHDEPSSASRSITIVGGGVASLFLGIELRERLPDASIEILTADEDPHVGGHLASWDEDGFPIEHGFHSLFGFYDAALPRLERAGLSESFTQGPDRVYLYENGGLHPLESGSLLRFGGHGLQQKLAMLPALWRVLSLQESAAGDGFDALDRFDALDFRELGRELGVGRAMLESNFVQMFYDFGFNGPLPMSAAVGLKTFFKLLSCPTLHHFNGPSRPTLIDPLTRRFVELGGRFEFGARLHRVELDPTGARAEALHLARRGGPEERVPVDQLVLALDLENFKRVGWCGAPEPAFARDARRLEGVSSISLQAWFRDDPVPAHVDHVIGGLPEPLSVVCPVTRVRGRGRGPHGYELIAVGPEAGSEGERDDVIVDRLFSTLRGVGFAIPSRLEGVHVHIHRNRSPGARYLLTRPGQLALRPRPRTPIENLTLAGAWLRTSFSLPSMQAAAQSAGLSADAIVERLGRDAAARRLELSAGAPSAPSIAPPAPTAPFGMPRSNPLSPPPPYRHGGIDGRFFLVEARTERMAEDLPPCLTFAPGFADRALVALMDYDDAYSHADPAGAVFEFREVVIAAIVRERDAGPARGYGLYPISIYITSDVAVAAGREVYGFPKKLADIELGPRHVSVRRAGRAPGEGRGRVHPIEILRGTFETAGDRPADDLADRVRLAGARAAGFGFETLAGLPFYNHQILPQPPGVGDGSPLCSRVLRMPLTDIEVTAARRLEGADLQVVASVQDPIADLAPRGGAELPVVAAMQFGLGFTVDRATVVADYTAPAIASPRRAATRGLLGGVVARLRAGVFA